MKKSVVGLTGALGGGKGVIADYLVGKGYKCFVFSDIIKDEINKRGLPITREVLQNVGNDLRLKFGNDVLAVRLAEKIVKDSTEKAVVDGIRNVGELKFLKDKFEDCLVIGVTASPDTRFKYVLKRDKPSDPKTREEFDRLEKRDRGYGEDSHGQQVEKCLDLADVVFENENTKKDLLKEVEKALK